MKKKTKEKLWTIAGIIVLILGAVYWTAYLLAYTGIWK